MRIIYNPNEWNEKAVIATIGFFDGVHGGHRFLLKEMLQLAEIQRIPSAVITFPVHPSIVLRPDYQPKLLNSFDEKIHLLSETGIDFIIVMDFSHDLSLQTAREFIASVLVPVWHVQTLFVGHNHRFGFQRAEGAEQYILDGKAYNMEVIKTSSYICNNGTAISSSMVRRLIETGDVATASRLLGYNYRLKGHVISGDKIGRGIGFPTANIMVDEKFKIIPQNGSYAVRVTIDDNKYIGMLYIGSRPTIGNHDSLRIEVNIFDFSEDIYDKSIIIEFIDYIREERKFDSIDELRKQMEDDRRKARDANEKREQ